MAKKPLNLRPISFKKSFMPHAEGSCLVTMGRTKVLCVASVEDRVPPHAEEKGIGWISAEYAMLPRAGETRSPRRKVAYGGRAQEISRLIGRSLRACVKLEELGPRSIIVDCDVLRADGGTRTAAINGGMVAVTLALKQLWKKKALVAWPLKEFIGAVSAGIIDKKLILDMDYKFDKEADADCNVVMTGTGQLIEIQGTAEGAPFAQKDLQKLIKVCYKGIRKIVSKQKAVVGPLPKGLGSR